MAEQLADYEAAVLEARALMGAPPPGQDDGRARILRALRAGTCAGCERQLQPAEPVWACTFGTQSLFGHSYLLASVCGDCYPKRNRGGWPIYRLGWSGPRRGPAYSPVHAGDAGGHRWRPASNSRSVARTRASREARNARRRQRPTERRCAVCGDPFTPARADARTCSPACRQRAYRGRRKGS